MSGRPVGANRQQSTACFAWTAVPIIVTIRVLLVEDDRRVHGIVADLLHSIGDLQPVATVTTEAEANLWLEENPLGWDLAIIDLILDEGTGMGVLAKCRARPAGGKAVVLSNYVSPAIFRHCMSLGANAVFHKAHDMGLFITYCGALH
jgi:DNA-binding NarL/FixJ family response regulator